MSLVIDFSRYDRDLITQELSRMLSQHYDKCVLRQFVAAVVQEAQELYEESIRLQQLRTIAFAEGENLDALGRIVGEDRVVWHYDDSYYMFFDRSGQSLDQAPMWVTNAPVGVSLAVKDAQYRINILARAIKNHTLTASIPEIQDFVSFALGTQVSFQKMGPNKVKLHVASNATMNALYMLLARSDDDRADNIWWMPYPATLDLDDSIMYMPPNFFMYDTANRGYDMAPVAVGTLINNII